MPAPNHSPGGVLSLAPDFLRPISIILTVLVCLGCAPGAWAQTLRVKANDERDIQRAIDKLPPAGGTIIVIANKKPLPVRASIVLDRDNVTLEGEGNVHLRLADSVNKPVIIMGQTLPMPMVTRTNLHVRNFTIDGNMAAQASELDYSNVELRNNGVSLRRIVDSSVENVTTFACRSGGLVTELGCYRVTVRNFESYGNYFDGLACYYTEDSLFTGLRLHDNHAAGISLDIDFVRNTISESVLSSNRSVGIFIRDSRENTFTNLQIIASGQHGIFMAQVDKDNTTPASGNRVVGGAITFSGGAGIRVNDLTCVSNLVSNVRFEKNAGGDISEVAPALVVRADRVKP